ncbi:MAG TPA: ABC transporter permease, partial [Firmicutes bacterium]|nr:ABC transporter permease [Bacillota bacterium]
MWTALDKKLLEEIAGLHDTPPGAYNIRKDGEGRQRRSLTGIEITPKRGSPGINVTVKPGIEGTVHIPVILTQTGLMDEVYNTIEIRAGADILLVAGCGIHNPGGELSRHDGIHEIVVRRGARLRYVEKHYGEGQGTGKRILNPKTVLVIEK